MHGKFLLFCVLVAAPLSPSPLYSVSSENTVKQLEENQTSCDLFVCVCVCVCVHLCLCVCVCVCVCVVFPLLQVLFNSEFLAEGTTINDFLHPDRVLIGGVGSEAGSP